MQKYFDKSKRSSITESNYTVKVEPKILKQLDEAS